MSLTLGEKLRQAREERGISLSEVAEQTRISSLYLQSIENDDYKPLPGGIFNKGFVKSYAKFIGVDEHEALQDYAKIVIQNEGRADDELKKYRPEVLTDDRTAGSMLPTIIFAGIILAMMTGGILFVVNYIQNQSDTPPGNSSVQNDTNTSREAETIAETPSEIPPFDEIKVAFTTTAEKVSVTANLDGTTRTEEVTRGRTSEFTAKERLRLSYYRGFADMVEVKLNGKPLSPPRPPAKGSLITFEINKENAVAVWRTGDVTAIPGSEPTAESTAESATPSPPTPATPEPTARKTVTATPTPRRTAVPTPTATIIPLPTRPRTTPEGTPRRTPTPVRRSPTPRATPD
jgi:cytoskeletal protein RodZ